MATPSESDNDSNGTVELSSLKENSENPEFKDEIDVFSCPVCLEHFKNPKCLPCQHTFCETCIDTYIRSSQTEYKGNVPLNSFLCPVCRQTVESPKSGSRPDEWAALLPRNQMILSLMGNAAKSEEKSEQLCHPCKRDNESSPGVFWCPNCSEYLCESCKKYHKRMKNSEMHKVVSIEEMDSSMPKCMTEDEEPCPEHQSESLKVYCIGHKKICCIMCLADNHRECKEIKSIDEMTGLMKKNKDSQAFINNLHGLKTKASKVSQKKQENLDVLSKQHQDLTDEVENLVELAKANLDHFKEDFKSKFNTLHKQQHMKVSETLHRVDCFTKTLEESEKMLKYVADHGTNKQLFITMEKVKIQLGAHMEQLKFVPGEEKEVQYILKTNENLTSVSKGKDFSNIILEHELCEKNIISVVESVKSVCEISDITQLNAMKLWDVNGKGLVIGCVFLSNETLVCAYCTDPTKLVAYDGYGKSICEEKLSKSAIGIAVNSEDEIFVAGFKTKCLNIYLLNQEKFDLIHTIEIPESTKGIAIFDSKIVLTCGNSIDIMTMFGSKLQSFPIAGCQGIVKTDCHCLTTNGSNVYYCLGKTLIIQSLSGAVIKEYEIPESLNNLCGIALDKNENIYICCNNCSKKICLVSRDCSKRRTFLTGNCRPFAIGFNESRTKFFVTMNIDDYSINNPVLEVYELTDKKNKI